MEKAIAPHITVQPKRGRATTNPAIPTRGKTINRTITPRAIAPATQGFRQRLQVLKNLFMELACMFSPQCSFSYLLNIPFYMRSNIYHFVDKSSWHLLPDDEFQPLEQEQVQ